MPTRRRTTRLCSAGFFGLWLVLATTAPVVAQEGGQSGAPTASEKRRAQKAFERGVALYEQKKYAEAIVQFKKGYHIVPNPIFLYNLGAAQARLGNYADAVDSTEEALDSKKLTGDVRVKTDALDRGSRVLLRASRIAPRIREAERDRDSEASSDVEAPAEPSAAAKSPGRDTGTGGLGTLGWVGVATAGAGGASLAVSAVLARGVSGDLDRLRELQRKRGSAAAFESKKSEIDRKQTLGRIMLFGGAGLAAVGAGLLTVDLLSSGASGASSGTAVRLQFDGDLTFAVEW